jgi:hypothetical protein
MTRSKLSIVAASVALMGSVACSQFNGGAPVRVVRNISDAGNCQKVGDVSAPKSVSENDAVSDVADQARRQGADTVVLAQGERTGTAYKCAMPSATAAK